MPHIKVKKNNFFFSTILGGLDGNALGCAIFEPMWAVFSGLIFFYLPLYMKALGVSEVQMGFINSLGAALGVVTSFIAGPITDRMGRKRTTLLFDIISWSGAMTVWAISQNFYFFVAAAVLNSFFKIPFTSWTCLAIEDTPTEKRVIFFGLIMIINLGSGIFTPVTGFLISRWGIVPVMRTLYLIGCISMTIMFFGRNYVTEETRIGMELMKHHSSISFKEKLRDYISAMKYMVNNSIVVTALGIMLLTNFQTAFQFFNVVYLKDTLGIPESLTSAIPGISAVINLVMYFVFIPLLMKKDEARNLILGFFLCIIGSGTYLLTRPGTYGILFVSTIFTAVGNMIMSIFRDTLWNNVIGESERAKIFSACQGIISIIAIPSGIMAGWMYKLNSIYPFVVNFIIFIVCLILALRAFNIKNKRSSYSSYSAS